MTEAKTNTERLRWLFILFSAAFAAVFFGSFLIGRYPVSFGYRYFK